MGVTYEEMKPIIERAREISKHTRIDSEITTISVSFYGISVLVSHKPDFITGEVTKSVMDNGDVHCAAYVDGIEYVWFEDKEDNDVKEISRKIS